MAERPPFRPAMGSRLVLAIALLFLALPVASQLPSLKKPAAPTAARTAPAVRRPPQLVQVLRQPGGWEKSLDRLRDRAVDFLPSLAAAMVVLVISFLLYRVSAGVLHGVLRRTRADPAVQEISIRLVKFVILGMGLVMAAGQLGFQIGSVLAGLGIVGLTVGFAAQDSLANLVAGFTILWDRPFHVGDNVTVAGIYGQVQQIGLRTTRISTVDKVDAILPNKTVINEKILNHTRNPHLRINVPVGIGYGEDIGKVRSALLEAIAGRPDLVTDPPPKVVVKELADSAVNLELRVWLRDAHKEREVFFDILELVKVTLDKEGVEMPFPQQTLHLDDDTLARLSGREAKREEKTAGDAPTAGRDAQPLPPKLP